MTILEIYISPPTVKLETSNLDSRKTSLKGVILGTLPLKEVMSLAHNHMANLFISSYRGVTIIRLLDDTALLNWG